MKTIIVQIDADEGQEARLQAAFDLVRAYEGHLVCLQVTPYAAYAIGDPATGGFATAALMEAIEKQRVSERTAVEAKVRAEGVSWNWVTLDGDFVERLSETARLADAVVMNSGPFRPGCRDAAVADGRCGLARARAGGGGFARQPRLCRHGHRAGGVGRVAGSGGGVARRPAHVAAGRQCRRADCRGKIPWLSRPRRCGVPVAARYRSRSHRAQGGRQSIEAVIRNVLTERRSAWLVQGAYGHSRLRQTLFGGVTRGLLADAPVPLVLAH